MDAGLIGGLAICSKNKLTIRRMGTLVRLGFVACSSHRREDRTGKSAHPTCRFSYRVTWSRTQTGEDNQKPPPAGPCAAAAGASLLTPGFGGVLVGLT